MRLKWQVTAVEERRPNVNYLLRHIAALEVVWDQRRDFMDTYLRACALAGHDPVVRLEDDVILTRNFQDKALECISEAPGCVHQLFSMRKLDVTIGTRVAPTSGFLMNQAVYLPAGLSAWLVRFAQTRKWLDVADRIPGIASDTFLRAGMKAAGIREYWLHCPSLVEHMDCRSVQNPKRSTKRQSKTFVDPELDGLPDLGRSDGGRVA